MGDNTEYTPIVSASSNPEIIDKLNDDVTDTFWQPESSDSKPEISIDLKDVERQFGQVVVTTSKPTTYTAVITDRAGEIVDTLVIVVFTFIFILNIPT